MIEKEIINLSARIIEDLSDDDPQVRDATCVLIAERDRLIGLLASRHAESIADVARAESLPVPVLKHAIN